MQPHGLCRAVQADMLPESVQFRHFIPQNIREVCGALLCEVVGVGEMNQITIEAFVMGIVIISDIHVRCDLRDRILKFLQKILRHQLNIRLREWSRDQNRGNLMCLTICRL